MTRKDKATIQRCLLVLAAACCLTACAMPTTVSTSWHERSGTVSDKYARILVVGVSENTRQRRRFENTLTNRLNESGITAWAAHTATPTGQALNRDAVAAAVGEKGADSAIVTRLVNQEISAKQIDERTGHKTKRKNRTPIDFFRYDYEEYEEPAYVEVEATVSLRTDFYETTEGRLLYSIDTVTPPRDSTQAVLDEVAGVIIKTLKEAGLIGK